MVLHSREHAAQGFNGAGSPAKSELEAMIRSCHDLEAPMQEIALDTEDYGLLSEETFCYSAPVVVELLKSITINARACTQDLASGEDDMDVEIEPVETEAALFQFVSEHRRVLQALVTQQPTLRTTGELYASLVMSLRSQRQALEAFRSALEMKYPLIRMTSGRHLDDMSNGLEAVTAAYVAVA